MATFDSRSHVMKTISKGDLCPHLEVLAEISGSRQKMSSARTNN